MEIKAIKRNRRKNIKSTYACWRPRRRRGRRHFCSRPVRYSGSYYQTAREAKTTANLNEWLTSPGLHPPKVTWLNERICERDLA
jgi:hypothetical protein